MKVLIPLILISIFLWSFSKADIDGPWIISKKGNVILYTRPLNYSATPSPNSVAINLILDEQNKALNTINKQLKTSFKANFSIYLFNYDEAKEKIGTNIGGYSRSKSSTIFYTYRDIVKLSNEGKRVFLGEHELVHIVTTNEFGRSNFRVLREGYAVAISGTFGIEQNSNGVIVDRAIEKWMKEYVLNHRILKPSEMIMDNDTPEILFYPQAGFFVRWLFVNYGVKKINRLYKSDNGNLKVTFERITGDNFEDMESRYLEYCYSVK